MARMLDLHPPPAVSTVTATSKRVTAAAAWRLHPSITYVPRL